MLIIEGLDVLNVWAIQVANSTIQRSNIKRRRTFFHVFMLMHEYNNNNNNNSNIYLYPLFWITL